MVTELFCIEGEIQWRRTVIRPRNYGPETECFFLVRGKAISVAINATPSQEFLGAVMAASRVSIHDHSDSSTTAATPDSSRCDQFEIRVRSTGAQCEATPYEATPYEATLRGPVIRWGPVDT